MRCVAMLEKVAQDSRNTERWVAAETGVWRGVLEVGACMSWWSVGVPQVRAGLILGFYARQALGRPPASPLGVRLTAPELALARALGASRIQPPPPSENRQPMQNKKIICLGSATWDTIFQVEVIPSAGIKVLPTRAVQLASGMATSAAVTIARLGGIDVHLWARLGADETGQRFIQDMQREGVNTDGLRTLAGTATAFSSIIVDKDGERAVIPFFDPQVPRDPAWLPLSEVAGAAAVLVDVRWVEGAAALLRQAARCAIPGILDADTASAHDLQTLIPLASHVLFSESALQIVMPGQPPDAALLALAQRCDAAVIGVTLGALGALIWTRASAAVLRISAPSIRAVDTLNAGDIWHGSFAWGLMQDWPIDKVVRCANLAAAMKCEVFGGRLGAPTWAQLTARAGTLGVDVSRTPD
jgi:sulfofructose kinase